MIKLKEILIAGFLTFASLTLISCDGGNSNESAESEAHNSATQEKFDLSQLPADFPRELIPGEYHRSVHAKLGKVESASFENRTPVKNTIDHYTKLVGKPASDADAGEGERMVQWHTKPWALTVIGKQDESIISFTRMSQ